jgi:hypothetical protein
MKYATPWALISASLVGIAYACATPEEINGCQPGTSSPDCDVILAQASDFAGPDASVGQGGSSGSSPSGGSSGAGNSTPPAEGGAAATSLPATGGSLGQGTAGSGQNAGAGGASGGSAGSAAGTGGAAGTAGSGAAGATANAGAGGTTAPSNFNPAACDFTNRAGCEARACATACPTNMGTYCSTNCPLIITCLSDNPACITAADPMCAVRNNGTPNQCSNQVETSGGATTTDPTTPAFVARALVNCLCDDARL